MKNKEFNVTQGMALLLLKPLNLPANYVLNLIMLIYTHLQNIYKAVILMEISKLLDFNSTPETA